MKAIAISICSIILALSATASFGADLKITIDRIAENDSISGTVSGLTQAGASTHIVVVYVKTNHWYIHPYREGGDGKSFASIDQNGKWTLGTERRTHPASEIAALVVKREAKMPPETENVRGIPNVGLVIRRLVNTPDHGKL